MLRLRLRPLKTTLGLALIFAFVTATSSHSIAQELVASDGAGFDNFGYSAGVSNDSAAVGVRDDDDGGTSSGSAYYFKNLSSHGGTINEAVKLTASDAASRDNLGGSLSLWGDAVIAGAQFNDDAGISSGSAYYFGGLHSATGTINESAKLTASDATANDEFGSSVSLSGDAAVVGARFNGTAGNRSGSAYYFRNLSGASGSVTEDVKLTGSTAAAGDDFGGAVSLSGHSAIVGAWKNDDVTGNAGSAYYFKNLDTASGTVSENAKLTASDAAADDAFGWSVGHSANAAIIGAFQNDDAGSNSGSAYYFKNLDVQSGTVTENVKLTASDASTQDQFGRSVGIWGNSAIVGAIGDDDNGADSGSAYYFDKLDLASGTVSETLKLTATDPKPTGSFGFSVGVSGDRIVVGAIRANSSTNDTGKAYTALASNMTTLDQGNIVRTHEAINFKSRTDWIIGSTTSGNLLTLAADTVAEIDEAGKSITIGATQGSDNNQLITEGTIRGSDFFIGSMDGNSGNQLIMADTGVLDVDNLFLAQGNALLIEGDVTDFADLLEYLEGTDRSTTLFVDNLLGGWQTIDNQNAGDFLKSSFDNTSGYTTISHLSAIPEPGSVTLIGLASAFMFTRRTRKQE